MALRLHVLGLALVVVALTISPQLADGSPARCFPAREFDFPSSVRVRGDIDGDRRPDTVSTRVRWLDSLSCRGRVVVDTRKRTYVRRIGTESGAFPLIAPPPVAALVPLDHRAGLEVVVQVWQGASTGFVELFGIRRGRLVRLDESPFAFSGSVTHRDGVDCVKRKGAVLVAGVAAFDGEGYAVERRFFSLPGSRLHLRGKLTERYRVGLDDLGRFPEFALVPFPGCAVVRPDY